MKTGELSDQQLADYSQKHLLYELHLFQWTARVAPSMDGVLRFALLESFVVHLRNLIDFFYPPNGQHDDDVVASDFFDNKNDWAQKISVALTKARNRANKEVSHLTLERKDDESLDKPWQVGELLKDVTTVAKDFANRASKAKLHGDVRQLLNSHGDKVVLVRDGDSCSTNTVSFSSFPA